MCTLSWILNDTGYEVFFNRDEQRSRNQATLPALDKNSGIIMPIDPESKGTWIASNSRGMSLCLLNNYQKQFAMDPGETYLSRGKIIPRLINSPQHNLADNLKNLELKNYLPFFLCYFPNGLTKKSTSEIYIFQWDGQQLTKEVARQPFISSGVLLEQVYAARCKTFTKIIDNNTSSQQHIAYHSSHLPDKNHLSVCMHREDARTQSLSHISVSNQITFRYHDGPPCEGNKWSEIRVKKIKT